MRKCRPVWILSVFTGLLLAGCGGAGETDSASGGKMEVYASLYPLAFFAEQIGGEHIQVHNLVPTGVEPHHYEPTAKDLASLSESDLFIYNGAGFEAWIEKTKSVLNEDRTRVVDTTESIDLLSASETSPAQEEHEEREHHDESEGEHEHDHSHYDKDPHVWLDPVRAKKQASVIRDALIEKDPKHKEDYQANYKDLAAKLDDLDQTFAENVKQGETDTFIVSHAAFGYLADRYGLKQVPVSGLSPSDEPSAKELKKIVKVARENDIQYIFFETLVSGKVADTVKKEVGARPLTLNPLGGLTRKQEAEGENYFSIMKQNAENLAKGLEAE
ncbi:metal ABC transporter substrate-binding protein [Paludifilum halophilum]|uniref:ABC transporter substrate-binding protein n=1 Tax=Paludifilum halophilum TaxID=1642702 RepID=A0A235B5Q1_9BACL|nr:metal ABC transporter substrate-binding protein [Paludifilum halophilum]OYD07561.1 hypothetical protein CHM34_11110 [Paludifilum halophilum]